MQQRTKAVVLAVLVVLLMCVMAYASRKQPSWAHLDFWKAHFIEEPDQIYARSSGVYDEAADLAFRRSEGAPNPTPADHLRAATIVHWNILAQGMRPGPDGLPTADAREISRQRQEMFGRARQHYAAALTGLTGAVIARDEADRAIRRFGLPGRPGEEPPDTPPRAEVPGRPGAEFIIDAALEFAFGGLETLVANDPRLAVLFFEEWEADGANMGFDLPNFGQLDPALAGLAEDRRAQTVETRRAAAAEVAEVHGGGRGAQVDAFLDLSQRHTSDPQNSHDPSVNAFKRAVVARLRGDQGEEARLPTLDQISEEIRLGGDDYSRDPRTGNPRPVLVDRALAVVDRARAGEFSASTRASDAEVLRRVWARADDTRNSDEQSHQLRQAAFDALVDCLERGIGGDQIRCVDGRISRMIGSLSLVDHDASNWNPQRLEQHKNDIFQLAADFVRGAAEDAARGEDPELRKIGRAFLAQSRAELEQAGAADPAAEKRWVDATRERLSEAIDAHMEDLEKRIPGAIPGYSAEAIKKEALAALD